MTRLLIALLTLVVLSACPNSCEKAVPSDSLSKDDYIKIMDAGCQRAREDAKPLRSELEGLNPTEKANSGKLYIGNANSREIYDVMIKAKAISDRTSVEQEKIVRPSQDSEDLEKFFKSRRQLEEAANAWLETLKNLADAPKDQIESLATQLWERQQKRNEYARAHNEAALKYGFKVCGSFIKQ